jgi:glycosidase
VPPTVLCYYRRLFALRRNSTALLRGAFAPLAFPEASTVAAYVRRRSEEQILVVANLSGEAAAWEPPQGSATLLLGNYPEASPETSGTMRPWECRVLRQEI